MADWKPNSGILHKIKPARCAVAREILERVTPTMSNMFTDVSSDLSIEISDLNVFPSTFSSKQVTPPFILNSVFIKVTKLFQLLNYYIQLFGCYRISGPFFALLVTLIRYTSKLGYIWIRCYNNFLSPCMIFKMFELLQFQNLRKSTPKTFFSKP